MLHLGCVDEHLTVARYGTGGLLHQELANACESVVGVDISEAGLREIEQLVPGRYIHGDVEELEQLDLPQDIDLVVAAEVIEHLGAPARFLAGLRGYLAATGATAVITTPNAYSWRSFSAVALRRAEPVHADHRHLYSVATLGRSLAEAGLEVVELRVHNWACTATPAGRVASVVDKVVLRWEPRLAVGLVVEVEPSS